MNTDSLTFVTGNPGKVEQVNRFLGCSLRHTAIDLTEVQSLDLEEIVEHKVREAYGKLKIPVLIEDVSLTFTALGKLPGPFIKWFEKSLGNEGLCRLLDGYETRRAHAEVIFALYDGKRLEKFYGISEGRISKEPKGEGFGWDIVFIPDGFEKTRGEMTLEEKDATSMRKSALKKLEAFLNDIEEKKQ